MTSEGFPARVALSRLFKATTRPYVLLGLGVVSFVGMGQHSGRHSSRSISASIGSRKSPWS